MNTQSFKYPSDCKPTFLISQDGNFWEIFLDIEKNTLKIFFGRFTTDGKKESTLHESKSFSKIDDLLQYAENQVIQKFQEGFSLCQNIPETASVKQNPATPKSNAKRVASKDIESTLKKSSKKIHRENLENIQNGKKTVSKNLLSDITLTGTLIDLGKNDVKISDKGALLVKENNLGFQYFKIQKITKHLKIQRGIVNIYNKKTKVLSFDTEEKALEYLKSQVLFFYDQGYKIEPEEFIFDFDETEFEKNPDVNFPEQNPQKPLSIIRIKEWKNEDDPTGWYICERKCGIRCYWTGTEFFSSKGTPYNPPQTFTAELPNIYLDGILCSEKESLGSVKNGLKNPHSWANLKFVIYDAPQINKPFEQRIETLKKKCHKINSSFIEVINYKKCQSQAHFLEELDACKEAGGEGFYLKRAGGLYIDNKACFEARVMLQQIGEIIDDSSLEVSGRSLKGSLKIKSKDGEQFSISVNQKRTRNLKKEAFQKGTQVRYEFCGMVTANKAKKPFFIGLVTQ